MITKFTNADVIVEPRANGVEPAIFIIENGIVHMILITPDGNITISNEGPVGTRYTADGVWCGE